MFAGRFVLLLALALPATAVAQDEPANVRPVSREVVQEPVTLIEHAALSNLWLPQCRERVDWGGCWTPRCGHQSGQACWRDLCDDLGTQAELIGADFRNLYCGENVLGLGVAVGIAAPLANTYADQRFRDWYQGRARGTTADEWSRVGKVFGEHWYVVPVFVTAAAGGAYLFPDDPAGQCVGTWGNRSVRALIVGCPAVGALQVGLGGRRPEEGRSHWRPFSDTNSVAGHGFVGAVPFLAAASVAERPAAKAVFFAGSFWTVWSRVHDDAHYLSQSILGWSIAYLAVRSVCQTDEQFGRVSVAPLELPEGVGVGVTVRY